MVAHERKIRARREEVCDEECPHVEARALWVEALATFGDRAQELTFLRSRATVASEPDDELVASEDVVSEAADRGRRSNGSGPKPVALQRSPELTQACSPKVDHIDFPPMTRASRDAHEAALLHLPSVVCAGPPRRPSPARVLGVGVSDRSPRADASLVASA
jgi:hypothetical protein